MKSGADKNKKKEDVQLMKARELKEKIESMKNDLAEKTKLMNIIKEQRENKIENIKQLEIKNKENYENFVNEYEQILNQYKNIEKEIHDMLDDLKMLSEKSYIELKKEKASILKNKNIIVEEKRKKLEEQVEKIELEISKHSNMLNDLLINIKEIFKKTHVQYEQEKDLKPLLIRLQNISKKNKIN
ncbi:conserved Plasmodium protein, unknown function [Plasmodium malariae]|uniref:Uncharacterized protein n=1 Tax=Plasmodium malariae TaxID=5858 RepID=A0A1C3KYG8_PLAMA|nr:conserved Plasmodium protein, unknown function [Plasmodium malariae]SBT79244.1 conserved Plasmodium protein, unknown function [Plasmodium malariae]SCN12208.1 conserved Plasmodium protein, unknown function [Plasmodium malariae]